MNTSIPATMKLYVVSDREHEDGDVIAIFSSRELAQETVDAYNNAYGSFLTARMFEQELDIGPLQMVQQGYAKYSLKGYHVGNDTVQHFAVSSITRGNCFGFRDTSVMFWTDSEGLNLIVIAKQPLSVDDMKIKALECYRMQQQ